jgi:hypothetical protein
MAEGEERKFRANELGHFERQGFHSFRSSAHHPPYTVAAPQN